MNKPKVSKLIVHIPTAIAGSVKETIQTTPVLEMYQDFMGIVIRSAGAEEEHVVPWSNVKHYWREVTGENKKVDLSPAKVG